LLRSSLLNGQAGFVSVFHMTASQVIRSIAALCKASAVPNGRGTHKCRKTNSR